MDKSEVANSKNLCTDLILGVHAADPLMMDDDEALILAAGAMMSILSMHGRSQLPLRAAIGAAYSLGARHALEQCERWTLAPAAEADECDLSVELPPVRHPPLTVPSDYPE